jgi:hypothetical protein
MSLLNRPRAGTGGSLAARRGVTLRQGCLMAGVLCLGPAALAQEALDSALSLDAGEAQAQALKRRATNAPAVWFPDAWHLGPVQLTVGVYAGVQVDDNINQAQTNPRSDAIVSSGLNLGFAWPATERSEVDLSSAVGYVKYLRYSANDQTQIAPGSVLTWKIDFEDGSLTCFDQFSDSQSVSSEASVNNLTVLPRTDNTAGARAEWDPGRWLIQIGASYDYFFSTAAVDQYLNRGTEEFFFRGGHRLAEDTQLGLEVSTSLTAYELPLQSNNTSYSLGPYLNWQFTPFINASVRGGYTIYTFEASRTQPAQNLDSYYANLTVTDQLTEFVSQTFSAERDISLGLTQGNDYNEQWTAHYSLNWAATTHLGLNLNLTYEDGTQPLSELIPVVLGGIPLEFPETITENYRRVGVSPGVTYQFTQKLGGSLTYTHWERTSNLSGNGYQDDNVAVQMTYSF